jgi:hypothetical protein
MSFGRVGVSYDLRLNITDYNKKLILSRPFMDDAYQLLILKAGLSGGVFLEGLACESVTGVQLLYRKDSRCIKR